MRLLAIAVIAAAIAVGLLVAAAIAREWREEDQRLPNVDWVGW